VINNSKDEVVTTLKQVPRHEDVTCLTKHHAIKMYPALNQVPRQEDVSFT